MVRFDDPIGERKHGVTEAMLLEVVLDTPAPGNQLAGSIKFDPLTMYRMDYCQDTGFHAYVEFAKAKTVNWSVETLVGGTGL